jgi:hypothetical protein
MTIKEARVLYKTTCETKEKLESEFGKKIISDNVMDRIKAYEDCCEEIGEQPINESELKKLGFADDEIAYHKLKQITKAINEGHEPDMLDTNEMKWFPVFEVDKSSPSGFVFRFADYNCSLAGAGDASRLCFETEAAATYAGKTFIDLYIRFINN